MKNPCTKKLGDIVLRWRYPDGHVEVDATVLVFNQTLQIERDEIPLVGQVMEDASQPSSGIFWRQMSAKVAVGFGFQDKHVEINVKTPAFLPDVSITIKKRYVPAIQKIMRDAQKWAERIERDDRLRA